MAWGLATRDLQLSEQRQHLGRRHLYRVCTSSSDDSCNDNWLRRVSARLPSPNNILSRHVYQLETIRHVIDSKVGYPETLFLTSSGQRGVPLCRPLASQMFQLNPLNLRHEPTTFRASPYCITSPKCSPVASLVLTDSSQLTSDSKHLGIYSSPVASLVLTDSSQLTSDSQHLGIYSSPVASLVLTDSSQLTSDSQHLGIDLHFDCQK
uniref:Uncharacterized protein n=1 Tax=Timema shepardi TaxID=629360 RepID=A0A7R9G7Y9_TIMSH|nr:unnamed protein product [Timema shepardi]